MAHQIKKKYIKPDAIDGSKIKLLPGESIRTTDSQGQEQDLIKLSTDGKVLAKGKEVSFKEDLDLERSRAVSAEAVLDQKIESETSSRISGDQALQVQIFEEVERATQEEESLRESIEEETLRASQAESALSSEIQSAKFSIEAEQARALAAESSIRTQLASEEALRASEDVRVLSEAKSYTDLEKTRAMAAEAAIRAEVDAEEILRASEDVRILSESKAYTDAEVLTEKNRAESVEAGLQTEIDNLETYVDSTFVTLSSKGQPNGVATLDASGLIPESQLPSYVDDVLEFQSLSIFPQVGEAGKIYVAIDTSKTYRWSGSVYVQITSGAVDTVFGRNGIVTAQAGDYSANQVTYGMGFVSDALQSLQLEIDNEEIRAQQAEQQIAMDLEYETSQRQFADQNLQFEIDAEEQRAIQAEQFIEQLITTETQNRFNADQFIQSELDATQIGAGLAIDGSYQPYNLASSSIFGATSLRDADIKLDMAISDEKFSRETADQAFQFELDATQTGAGLNSFGNYIVPAMSNYINIATSLHEADVILDGKVKELSDNAGYAQTVVAALQSELDLTQVGAGLDSSGAYFSSMTSNYLGMATSLFDADMKLDTKIKENFDAIVLAEGEIDQLQSEVFTLQGEVVALDGKIETEKGRIDAILAASSADYDSFAEIVALINSVDIENDSAFAAYVLSNNAAVGELDGRLDVIEPKVSTLESEMIAVEGRLDILEPKVATLEFEMDQAQFDIDAVEARLDVIEPKVATLESEMDQVQSDINAEEARAIAREAELQEQILAVGLGFKKETFTMTQSIIDSSEITLAFKAFENSTTISIDRLFLIEDIDYTVSTHNNVSKITFIGSILEDQAEALEIGDLIKVKYFKDMRS